MIRIGTKRGAVIALAAAASALTAASPAAARVTTLTGQTATGAAVKLIVGDFGNATSFKVAGEQINCRRGGTLRTRATTFARLDTSDPGSFRDRSKLKSKGGGFRFTAEFRLAGTIAPDGLSWSGSYKETTKVFKRGDKIDTCKRKTTWTAA